MKNNFFYGAMVKLHNDTTIPSILRGQMVMIISKGKEQYGALKLWRSVASSGITVMLNDDAGTVVHPSGSRPSPFTMESLLRICNVDPKILRAEGAE